MAVIEGGTSGLMAEVGLPTAGNKATDKTQHATLKPVPYGSLGHYRVNHRALLANTQAANARIFELRNTHATNLIVITRLVIKTIQSAAGTAQDNSLDVFKVTGFSAVDTTNTVTPTASIKRNDMAAAPGGAAVRGVTAAGAAAGMTGGTLVKDGGTIGQHPISVQAAVQYLPWPTDVFDDVNGTHPFVFANNEGLIVENRVLNVTSYGVMAYIDCSWVETTAY